MEANTLNPKPATSPDIESIGSDYADRYGFRDPEEYFHKGRKGVDHEVVEMLRLRMFAIATGYEDAEDCDVSRHDPIFKVAVGARRRWARRCARSRP